MGYEPLRKVNIIYTSDTTGHRCNTTLIDADESELNTCAAVAADVLIIHGKVYDAKIFVDILEEFNNLNRCPRCKFKFRRLEGGCSLASCNFSEQEKS